MALSVSAAAAAGEQISRTNLSHFYNYSQVHSLKCLTEVQRHLALVDALAVGVFKERGLF